MHSMKNSCFCFFETAFLTSTFLTRRAICLPKVKNVSNGAEALRLMYRRYNLLTQGRKLAKLNEMLQVDVGTDERTYMDHAVRWQQWAHEYGTLSRETLPDIVKRAIITERAPPTMRTHLLVNAQTLTEYEDTEKGLRFEGYCGHW